MHKAKRTTLPVSLCTTMMLFAGPAMAHEGPHHLTYLQSLLHALAHADYLAAAMAVVAIGTFAFLQPTRRKTVRAKL